MMLIPNNGFFGVVKMFFNKHANLIFGILGVAGVAGTAVCASVATKNALDILREHEEEELTTKDKVKLVWPEYIWTAIVAAGTGTSIVASNIISAKRAAALSAALIIAKEQLDTTRAVFDDYRQETLKYLPQDPEEQKKIQKIIEKRPKDTEPSKYFKDHLGDILHIVETDTGIEYDCRLVDLDTGINWANSVINEQGFVSLNAFHESIPNTDIPNAEIGWDIGWDGMRDGLISYSTDCHLEQGPNGEGVIMVYVTFTKCPSVHYR
jgi:hypothetical protein